MSEEAPLLGVRAVCPDCGEPVERAGWTCGRCAEEEHFDVDPDDEGPDCVWCGGEGFDECSDSIECCNEHDERGFCPCSACGGSGLRKDQTIW